MTLTKHVEVPVGAGIEVCPVDRLKLEEIEKELAEAQKGNDEDRRGFVFYRAPQLIRGVRYWMAQTAREQGRE